MGCPLEIEERDGAVVVAGNTCKRGEIYGIDEYTSPKRTVTSLIRLQNGEVASVKTSVPIDKKRVREMAKALASVQAPDDAKIGDIVCKDFLGLGADIIITGRK